MNPDGSDETRITDNPDFDHFHPYWSPDGGKIVFYSNRDGGDDEIYVMDVDGSNPTQLTSTFGDNFDPAWSPDGSKIAFVSSRDGLDDEIYVMDADGSNQPRLTDRRGPDQGACLVAR